MVRKEREAQEKERIEKEKQMKEDVIQKLKQNAGLLFKFFLLYEFYGRIVSYYRYFFRS